MLGLQRFKPFTPCHWERVAALFGPIFNSGPTRLGDVDEAKFARLRPRKLRESLDSLRPPRLSNGRCGSCTHGSHPRACARRVVEVKLGSEYELAIEIN